MNTRQKPDPQADTLPSPDAAPALESADMAIPRSRAPQLAGGALSACLSDGEVLDYVEGRATDTLRGRVQSHIDDCGDCAEVLLSAIGHESPSGAAPGVEPTTFAPGTLVKERYLIERFVGKGGMGEVYAAFDQLMSKRVALKTLLCTASDDPRAVRKLFAEVLNAQRVGHPHVCRINELQEHQQSGRPPVPFFTMEFVEGERLGVRLRRAPLALPEARVVAHQLLDGLRAAHAKGVLHLDFKSDNVLLRSGANEPDAVIMDFGLSRAQDGEARLRTSEQLLGAGTLPYMAIEQLECRSTLGPEADIYAFGVVMYEMLTGHLPFEGDSLGAILLKQLRERPLPPSSAVPGLNPELDAFVLKCLSSDPRQRFPNASEALAALSRIEPWQVPPRRERRRWLALGALSLLIASFGVLASVSHREAVMSNLPAATPPASASSAAKLPAPTPRASTSSAASPPAPSPPASASSGAEPPPPEAARDIASSVQPEAPVLSTSAARAPAPPRELRARTESKKPRAQAPAAPPRAAASGSPASPRARAAEAPASWPALPRLVPIEPVPLPRSAKSASDSAR